MKYFFFFGHRFFIIDGSLLLGYNRKHCRQVNSRTSLYSVCADIIGSVCHLYYKIEMAVASLNLNKLV